MIEIAKAKNNSKKSLERITSNEILRKELITIAYIKIGNTIATLRKNKTINKFIAEEKDKKNLADRSSEHSYLERPHTVHSIRKGLNDYSKKLQQHFLKHLTDTTSWSRRYIKQLPPEQQKNPPSFAEFYFKGASQEEALVVLSTLQLGILQEALEIQEKILKE